jgi:hypothetical protein
MIKKVLAAVLVAASLLITPAYAVDGYLVGTYPDYYASNFRGEYQLIDNAGATDSGVWVDFNQYRTGSIDVTGTFVATLQLMGSNAQNIPSNVTDGNIIGSNITTAGLTAVTMPVRWIKVKVSAYTSGNVTVMLHARN